ncbi:MAG: hypothetical protein ABI128_00085 [Rhodanobacter sp.]
MPALRAHKPIASPSLHAMLAAAYRADPVEELICPVAGNNDSTLFGLIPAALAVLRVAAQIEPEPAEAMRWYRTIRIEHLGNLTAKKLVAAGRAEEVIHFLRAILDDPFA